MRKRKRGRGEEEREDEDENEEREIQWQTTSAAKEFRIIQELLVTFSPHYVGTVCAFLRVSSICIQRVKPVV